LFISKLRELSVFFLCKCYHFYIFLWKYNKLSLINLFALAFFTLIFCNFCFLHFSPFDFSCVECLGFLLSYLSFRISLEPCSLWVKWELLLPYLSITDFPPLKKETLLSFLIMKILSDLIISSLQREHGRKALTNLCLRR